MTKRYMVCRKCTVWIKEYYDLEGTDEENEAFLKKEAERPDYERGYENFIVENETLEEMSPGENGGYDTIEIVDITNPSKPKDISL